MTTARIAHFIDSLGTGGAEQALLDLSVGLKGTGAEVVVIPLFSAGHSLREAYVNSGIEVIDINFNGKWNLLKNTMLVKNILREKKIDIAHSHLFFSGIYVGLTKLLSLRTIRAISFHNLAYAPGCNPRNLSYFLRKTLNWFVLRYCYDHVFSVSNAVAEHYIEHFSLNRKRLSILPNGINLESYNRNSCLRNVSNKREDPFRFVALGRLVKEKGYQDLLNAFSLLRSTIDLPLELTIIGGGPLEDELRSKVAELNISEAVSFTGSVDHKEALDFLEAADAFVCSSIFEGFGIAVAEAALLEKLIVATRVGGVTDVVNDKTGVLVSSNQPDELADGMRQAILMSEEEREAKVSLAKQEVRQLCDIDSIIARLANTYDSLLISKAEN